MPLENCGTTLRALLIALLFLMFSVTAAAAQGSSSIDCDDAFTTATKIEHWPNAVKAAYADTTPQSLGVDLSDKDCLACHNDSGRLIELVKPPAAMSADGCACPPSRPHFLGYLVNTDFTDTVHGALGCAGCHGGQSEAITFILRDGPCGTV